MCIDVCISYSKISLKISLEVELTVIWRLYDILESLSSRLKVGLVRVDFELTTVAIMQYSFFIIMSWTGLTSRSREIKLPFIENKNISYIVFLNEI